MSAYVIAGFVAGIVVGFVAGAVSVLRSWAGARRAQVEYLKQALHKARIVHSDHKYESLSRDVQRTIDILEETETGT